MLICLAAQAQDALEPAVYGNYASESKDVFVQYYNEKRTKELRLRRLSCGVYVSQSFRKEGVLGYDAAKHALVYNESMKNIWSQAYKEMMELEQTDEHTSRWVLRKKPHRPWTVPVAYHQVRISDELALELQQLWFNAISAGREDPSQLLVMDGTTYDFFVKGVCPMYARTNGWAEKAPEGHVYIVHRLLKLNHKIITAVKAGKRKDLEAMRDEIRTLSDDFYKSVKTDDNAPKFMHAF